MDYSYIFRSARAKPETFADFGFVPQGNTTDVSSDGRFAHDSVYICTKTLSDSAFYVVLTVSCSRGTGETCVPASGGSLGSSANNDATHTDPCCDFDTLSASVYDATTGDKYALFEVPAAHGAFVAQIREQVLSIIEAFRRCCFETTDLKDRYVAFLKARFGADPEFPWADTPDCCVFRCKNSKWFALLMQVKFRQLGFSGGANSEEAVWAVNMKAIPNEIPSLIDKKSVFPAWHMNKKHWITVLLTAVTDFDRLCSLTEQSYKLVSDKRKGYEP